MQGVIVYFRVVDGQLTKGDVIKLMNTRKEYEVAEVGVLAPKPVPVSPAVPGGADLADLTGACCACLQPTLPCLCS